MRITAQMLLKLEQAIAPDASAEVRIYAGGCDIRVRWNKGLREANYNVGAVQLSQVQELEEEAMNQRWDSLIRKFQKLRDM